LIEQFHQQDEDADMTHEDQQDATTTTTTAPAVDPLALLSDLAKLFANPAKLQRAIEKFETARSAAARAETKLAAASAASEERLRVREAEVEQGEKDLLARRLKVRETEGLLNHREEGLRAREAELNKRDIVIDDWSPPAGSGMSREPDPTSERYRRRQAADGTDFPAHTTVTRS
jgi:uncharacterized protein (DUF3084 family)